MSMHKMKVEEVGWVLSIGRQAASSYLQYFHPELTPEEHQKIMSGVQDRGIPLKQQTSSNYDPTRNKFVGAAWLVGASFRQLAMLFGVKPQTMMNARDKALNMMLLRGAKKGAGRFVEPPLSYLKLSAMWEFYQHLVKTQRDLMEGIEAHVLGKMFQDMPEPSEDEGSAYDTEVFVPDVKLGNVVEPAPQPEVESIADVPPEPSATVEPPKVRDAFSPDTFDYSILSKP